ncbi:MAG: ribbon-helix-helix domain-containing protein [Propionibacteriaceae bacterium]|jgi:metal-responsive CopG/Arc/MetJ family transcriptional regulator|nr:ribbon-helix-helix domain-containing protein [Propionibacteriaceae bacterium]
MQRTNIYLADRQTEALDRLATEEQVSRAEVIRRLIDRGLTGTNTLDDDLATIDQTFGAMAGAVAPQRTPDAREVWLERLWQS